MAGELEPDEIPTADATDTTIRSKGWQWPAAYLATVILVIPVAGIAVLLPEAAGTGLLYLLFLAMFVSFWGGLYFGLKDFYNVKKSAEKWNPSFWRYFLINFLLTPIVSFSVYLFQRYRYTDFKVELERGRVREAE